MKSLYEMNEQELADYRPQDMQEAFIQTSAPLVEAWSKTPYLQDDIGGAIPGKTVHDRDHFKAVMAQCFQNTVNTMVGKEGKKELTPQQAIGIAENASKNFGKMPAADILTEAAATAQTNAYSGATLLPVVLGMQRKVMPRINALQYYAIQPLDRPSGRVFFLKRLRDNNNTTAGQTTARAGWSYRSFIDDPGEDTAITKAVKFTISSSDVTTPTSHKVLAKTSIELEQDLRAYFSMDAVALVSDIAAEELAVELDEILIHNILDQGRIAGVGKFQYGLSGVPSGHTVESYDKRIWEVIARARTAVFTRQRVQPNYIVGGTDWEVQLANTGLWRTNTEGEVALRNFVDPQPTLLGRFNYATVPFPYPQTTAIMGYKGDAFVDANAIYLPYVPVQLYGVHADPVTMERQLSWISRYAIYNCKFDDAVAAYAWLELNSGITGTSYAALAEYV